VGFAPTGVEVAAAVDVGGLAIVVAELGETIEGMLVGAIEGILVGAVGRIFVGAADWLTAEDGGSGPSNGAVELVPCAATIGTMKHKAKKPFPSE